MAEPTRGRNARSNHTEDTMAEGDADREQGAEQEADAGSAGEKNTEGADAGQDNAGATGGEMAAEKLQAAYNRGAKETREALEGKLGEYEQRVNELEQKLEKRESDSDGGDGEKDRIAVEERDDLYTEEQVRQMKESHQSKIEELGERVETLQQTVERVNRADARNRLVEAFRERGVIKPEVFADALIAEGRVRADVTEGSYEVFTSDGNRMLNGDGEHASVEDLADAWVKDNPEFQESSQRGGAGYSDTGGRPSRGWKPAHKMSKEEKRQFIADEGIEAWREHVDKSYTDRAA